MALFNALYIFLFSSIFKFLSVLDSILCRVSSNTMHRVLQATIYLASGIFIAYGSVGDIINESSKIFPKYFGIIYSEKS